MKKYIILFIIILILIPEIIMANPKFILIYVVQSGDTLIEIAQKYNVSTEDIINKNNLNKNKFIKPGEELIIPDSDNNNDFSPNWNNNLYQDTSEKSNTQFDLEVDINYAIRINPEKSLPEVDIPESEIIKYHVSRGDTLYDLAREFNTSIGIIMALNNMENNIVRTGQTLRLPINNLTPKQILARTITQKEKKILARAIHGEARGEPFQGQVAVGAVIINRVISSAFPDTFREVIYQPGQFSVVADGQINLTPNQNAYTAAQRALEGYDPTMGSLYYYNPKTAKNQWWFATREKILTIGDHVFAK